MLDFFPVPFLIGVLTLGFSLPLVWLRKRKIAYLATYTLFGFYMLMVVGLTLFPIPKPFSGEERQPVEYILSRINWIYFYSRYSHTLFLIRREMLANIFLTIPFGILFPWITRIRVWMFLLLSPWLGIGIETAQLILSLYTGASYRVTDVNDVILNWAGTLIGFFIFLIVFWVGRFFQSSAAQS